MGPEVGVSGNEHKGMRKADFSPIDETISQTFEDSEKVMVFGVKEEGGEGLLGIMISAQSSDYGIVGNAPL